MRHAETDNPTLSIVIAVVSGLGALTRCLEQIYPQAPENNAEIIVPYDLLTPDVLNLSARFPTVRFVEVPVSNALADLSANSIKHVHYDLRRSCGLTHARGGLIALTEDHAVPAADWFEQIIRAHDEYKDTAVIGGAIENEVDRPFNWAWYYCDFGRYGRPFASQNIEFVSDVNVSYKREAIMSVKDLWESGFHETTVHWALARKGEKLALDPRLVVFQHRGALPIGRALRERVEWGKAFAATRADETSKPGRALLAVGCLVLPFILFLRAVSNMRRQERPVSQIFQLSPLVFAFVSFWSVGEAIGYLTPSDEGRHSPSNNLETSVSSTL